MFKDKVFIIAEAGVNHNGKLENALKLIDIASAAGADAVKFQTFKAEKVVSRFAGKAEYQLETTDNNETQFEMIRKLELDQKVHEILIRHCKKKKIKFLSTPFDFESIDMLTEIGVDTFKVPSGEINNLPYLRKIGGLGKKIILSSGMSTIGEIEFALNVLTGVGTLKSNITVLHCTTEYPAPFSEVNLRAMLTIKETFKVDVGYSDHTPGIEIPIAAVAYGASVIEKHFTISKKMEGPDHKASLEPEELRMMVKAIRNVEKAVGDGIKKPSRSEMKNIKVIRKSIVASRNIKKGETFSPDNIDVKRPGDGISPVMWDSVIGRKAIKEFKKDQLIVI